MGRFGSRAVGALRLAVKAACVAAESARRRCSGARPNSHRQAGCAHWSELLESRTLLAVNPIVLENQLPGTPQSEWDLVGIGDTTIQGYSTDISVNVGQRVDFKIDNDLTAPYRLDIYRMGYYAGMGARKVATVPSSQTLRVNQPAPLTVASTGLVDAGNWSVTASWDVPTSATSGIYFARIVREDTGGASRILFIVRNDDSKSDLLFQTSDATWQSYNDYGNQSLYVGSSTAAPGRAVKVSYNRPMTIEDQPGGNGTYNSPFNAEYAMVRWIERNGYDVSYFTNVDTDRFGSEIKEHKVFVSVGHDEYWSTQMRNNVEAAREAGVNLAFFSGNEIFWKIRWENSIDASGTPYRTLVGYRESKNNAKIDPSPIWTGTWRDDRFVGPPEGGRPENSLTGTLYMADRTSVDIGISMQVPAEFSGLRFWRNTAVASLQPGQVATLGDRVLGYETDEDVDNGFRPAGLLRMSSTTFNTQFRVNVPWGSQVAPGVSTHNITLYRAQSGALVFGAGTIQWSYGLDGVHLNGNSIPDRSMQQATVNLLADMGAQPETIQADLVRQAMSTDLVGPTVAITSLASGASLTAGTPVTINGSATDTGGGLVAAVEVSTDGGRTWHPATGRGAWSYTWTPKTPGPTRILSRASDDSANVGQASAPVDIVVNLPATSAAGLVAAYNFNAGSGTTLANAAGAGNVGTISGATWSNQGRFGTNALSFDGVNDWVTVPDSASLDLTTGMTMEAWIRPNDISRFTTVIIKESSSNLAYTLYASDGADRPPAVWISTGPDFTAPGPANAALNTWVHLAATYDGSTLSLYINGELASTDTSDGNPIVVTTGALRIGGNSIWGEYFQGLIDEVRIYNRALNAVEVLTDMNTPVGGTLDATAPTVSVSSPASGASLANAVNLTAVVTDNLIVSGVQFLLNGEPIGAEDRVAPYTAAWDTRKYVNGAYVLTARARDAAGNIRTSAPVNVTVANPADAAAPAVTLNHPWTNDAISGTSVLWAVAGDNIGVTGVQFKVNGVNVGPLLTSAPYRFPWNADATGSGPATITAVAFDAAGNSTSVNAFVTVDATPPTVTSFAPTDAATAVSPSFRPRAIFSEPVVPGTVRFEVRNPAGNLVAGSLTYSDATRTMTFVPNASLTLQTRYTVTVGSARDPLGNAMTSDVVWSFTIDSTIPRATLWSNDALPVNPASGDTAQVEVGVRFTSDIGGYVKGVRFYKGAGNTGPHVGHLWSATGTLLATATFANEGASGWQEVTFSTPVAINANTTYVASYYAPVGRYAADPNYFAAPRNSAPLYASTGVFAYGSGGGFPTQSFNAANYWVDVVFGTTLLDIAAPQVSGTTPAGGASGVSTTASVRATFNEPVVAGSIQFELRDGANNLVASTVSYDAATTTMTAVPDSPLATNVTYVARVSGATDPAGNVMAPFTWSFSTLPPDLTAPVATSLTPAANQTAVAPKTNIAVRFNEPIRPSSVSLRLLDVGRNEEVPGAVSYDPATNTASLTIVSGPLRTATQFRATLSGVQDLSGNVMADVVWTFTTDDLITGASLWGGGAVPAVASVAERNAIEVGVRFQTVQAGYITALRYYKGAENAGVHVGHLWDASGVQLASATFTNESVSGWQQVNFVTPVLIQADTTYVASYYAPNGGYAASTGYFSGGAFVNGVLRASGDAESGGNGVFIYGAGGAFPTQTLNGSNYWVDVVYANTLAHVVQHTPASGTAIAVGSNLTATFSLPVVAASITFELRDSANVVVSGAITYDAATNRATFNPTADLSPSSEYAVTIKATDIYGNASVTASFSFLTQAGPDTVSPSVTGRTPAPASDGNSRQANVGATFSEAIQPGTLLFVLRDLLGNGVPAAVTYDSATRTATLDPTVLLDGETTYTATVQAAVDLSGNPLGAPVSWTFTTGTLTSPTIEGASIWGPDATPATASANDSLTIELGVKFQADYDGYITGLRFYKGPSNLGTHVGRLWTAAGTLLGSATFTNETATGWQEVKFAAPIPIVASTTYVASYFAPVGGYAVTGGNFAAGGVDNGALHALPSSTSGGNGVFRYGGGFPTQSFNSINYWVDVVYATFIDTSPATLTAQTPSPGAADVASDTVVAATFNEAVQPESISFVLTDSDGFAVPATVSYDATNRIVTLTPNSSLFGPVTYTATLSGAKDMANNLMSPVSWTFTTAAVPVPAIPIASIWPASTVPGIPSSSDLTAVELGLRFRVDYDGYVMGVRFYKGANNTGNHVGHLWSSDGTLLATAAFVDETATGWQQANFDVPVSVTRGRVYVVSYFAPNGGYAATAGYFGAGGTDSGALHALANNLPGGNGVFKSGTGFPNQTFNASNYWVDIVYTTVADSTAPVVSGRTPAPGATGVPVTQGATFTFNEDVRPESVTFTLKNASGDDIFGTLAYNPATRTATFAPAGPLGGLSAYTATVSGARDAFGNVMSGSVSWSFTTAAAPAPAIEGATLFAPTATPSVLSANDGSSVELGVKFRADYNGYITGIRFYKGPTNTGTHLGHLWTASGTLLATVTFTNETASGWQQANFSTPVAITAGTIYVASYLAPVGRYSATGGYFNTASDNGALHAPRSVAGSLNGVYRYGNGLFPNQNYNATNYWVDVVYSTVLDTTAPTITARTPAAGAAGVPVGTAVTVTFSEPVQPATLSMQLRDASNTLVNANVTYDPATRTASLTPTSVLNPGETFTVTVSGARDLTGNILASAATWSFTTSLTGVRQTTAADFSTGTMSGTQATSTAGGELQLVATMALSDSFSGTALSGDWTTSSWASSGGGPMSVAVSGGVLSLRGGQVLSAASFAHMPLEARVSIDAATFQHFGFATNLAVVSGQYWALFSTMNTTGTLFARVNVNGTQTNVSLGARPSGFHQYRIQPVATGFQFYVDNVLMTTINAVIPAATEMKVAFSSFSGSPAPALQVDTVTISSYTPTGTFVSAVLGAAAPVTWGTIDWTATAPPGTSILIETRTGNTAAVDGSWSVWSAATDGGVIGSPAGQYIQYRVTLTTADGNSTPILLDILLSWA